MVDHETFDLDRILVWHDTDRELADDFARNDGLGAGSIESALHAVDRQRRKSPLVHQRVDLVVVDQLEAAALSQIVVLFDEK